MKTLIRSTGHRINASIAAIARPDKAFATFRSRRAIGNFYSMM